MIPIRFHPFACFLVLLFAGMTNASDTTVAVLDFENNSIQDPLTYQPLAQGLAEIMITEFQQVESIRVVERQRLRTLLDELKLSQSGLLSPETSVTVGKMLGAKYLVFGGFMVTMNNKIRIDVRIVEVETGLTVKASEETGKTHQVLSLIGNLSIKLLKDIHIRLSKNEEQQLNRSQDFNVDAVLAFSKGVESEDAQQWEQAKTYYRKALTLNPGFTQAGLRLDKLLQSQPLQE